MSFRIQLTRYELQNVNWTYYGAYRMRVEVTAIEGDGLDPNIFIYQRGDANPYLDGASCDDFVAIAGPAQIADVPIGEPDANRQYPFYRLSYIEHDFTAKSLADEVWQIIQAEARILCEAMSKLSSLDVTEEVWVPDQPPAD